jgi:hypothetical protein
LRIGCEGRAPIVWLFVVVTHCDDVFGGNKDSNECVRYWYNRCEEEVVMKDR